MKKEVSYKISGNEWKEAQDKAFNKLNKNAKIDGFRPGKATRSMFEKKYGVGEIYNEAADKFINAKYMEALTNEEIKPIMQPNVEIVSVDGDALEFKFIFIMKPEVKLGEYKNLGVKKSSVRVTKEEIEHEIGHICERFAELVSKDGKVENGDITIIDFDGYKDGVPFEGGKASNYQLEIGSNSFIPGFEDGMIGMAKDEERDIELTFPEDYQAKELAGQKVVFKVKVNDIKKRVIPEMDKDFFEDLDMEGIDSKEKLEEKVKSELKERKEKENDDKYLAELLDKATSNMECEIDDEIVHEEAHHMYHQFMHNMEMQGINEEMYLKFTNSTEEQLVATMEKEALKRIKNSYLLEEVAKQENISVSDADIDAKIEEIANEYKVDKDKVLESLNISREDIKYNIELDKAIEVLKSNN